MKGDNKFLLFFSLSLSQPDSGNETPIISSGHLRIRTGISLFVSNPPLMSSKLVTFLSPKNVKITK